MLFKWTICNVFWLFYSIFLLHLLLELLLFVIIQIDHEFYFSTIP